MRRATPATNSSEAATSRKALKRLPLSVSIDHLAELHRAIRKRPPPPVYLSLPRNGEVDPWFGCTRGYWNDLIYPNARNEFHPQVKSITDHTRASDRKDGKGPRGKRFIVFSSALEFFSKLANEKQEAVCA